MASLGIRPLTSAYSRCRWVTRKGTLLTQRFYISAMAAGACVAGDFNKDGKTDFALVSSASPDSPGPACLQIFLNKGNGLFQENTAQEAPLENNFIASGAVTVGDFNGDGKPDIAWGDQGPKGNTHNAFAIHYRYGKGDGSFGADNWYICDGSVISLASADLNRDGKADLIAGLNYKVDRTGKQVAGAQPRIATLMTKARGGFAWASGTTAFLPQFLRVVDFNGDGLPDLVINRAFHTVDRKKPFPNCTGPVRNFLLPVGKSLDALRNGFT